MYVYAIEINNMEPCSDDYYHYVLEDVYADKNTAVKMLENRGFKPVNDHLYVWQPTKKESYDNAPFIYTECGVEANIVKCEVHLS